MVINTPQQLLVWEARLLSEDFAFDFETIGYRISEGVKALGVSFATADDKCYLPIAHRDNPISKKQALKFLSVVMNSKALKIAHNLQFDMAVCWTLGVDVRMPFGCTMIAAFNHDNTRYEYNLASVCRYYGIPPSVDFDELTDGGRISIDTFSCDEVAKYSMEHARNTLDVYRRIERCLKASEQWITYSEIDVPCIPSAVWIEMSGVCVDVDKANALSAEMLSRASDLEDEIIQSVGTSFNIRSGAQLGSYLYKTLRLPVLKRTAIKKEPATDKKVLKQLRHIVSDGKNKSVYAIDSDRIVEVIDSILEYKSVLKLRDTVEEIIDWEMDGRVYTKVNMTVARSGRFSSSKPNLQNVPHFDNYGIRTLFIAPPGRLLSVCDFSQIEMRIGAIFSRDKTLLDVYKNNEDVHTITCKLLFGDVTPEKRHIAKTINFAIGYGMGPEALSESLNISYKDAVKYQDRYWEVYDGLNTFNSFQKGMARMTSDTRTLTGRRRILPNINTSNVFMRSADERIATNHPIQGTAADIMKMAQTAVYERFKNTDVKCVLTVHDELVLEGPEDSIDEIMEIQKQIMASVGGRVSFDIDLLVEGKTGRNWGECH